RVWYHPRPFVDHPRETVLLVRHAADNSFPSDHATVAFAIAFSVLAFHRRLGLAFLAAAIAVAVVRVLVGVHYPVDVGASALVAAGSTAVVVTVGRPWVVRLASLGSRIAAVGGYQTDRTSSAICSALAGRGFALAPGRTAVASATSSSS
ncbi:MAG: hypothetical protein C4305_04580, partial [Thermoleophilia bacterium]